MKRGELVWPRSGSKKAGRAHRILTVSVSGSVVKTFCGLTLSGFHSLHRTDGERECGPCNAAWHKAGTGQQVGLFDAPPEPEPEPEPEYDAEKVIAWLKREGYRVTRGATSRVSDEDERARLSAQCREILALLRARGPNGVWNTELAEIALKYTGRVSELRGAGFKIQIHERDGARNRYVLEFDPENQ
jgi:hypothetical protein